MINFFFTFLFLSHPLFAEVIPASQNGTETSYEARLFKNTELADIVFEMKYRNELARNDYFQQAIGFYRRENDYLKWGTFLWRETGVINDFDWVKKDVEWGLRDVQNRTVYSLMGDITGNYFFEKSDLLLELKNRYFFNLNQGLEQLRIRPGISKFLRQKDKIKYSLFFQYEFYIPINYGQGGIYERWAYLGFLTHFQFTSVGPYLAYRIRHWNNSDEFNRKTGQSFEATNKSWVLALVSNFYF